MNSSRTNLLNYIGTELYHFVTIQCLIPFPFLQLLVYRCKYFSFNSFPVPINTCLRIFCYFNTFVVPNYRPISFLLLSLRCFSVFISFKRFLYVYSFFLLLHLQSATDIIWSLTYACSSVTQMTLDLYSCVCESVVHLPHFSAVTPLCLLLTKQLRHFDCS